MKQLYTLNPDIKSCDEFLEAYNKSIKTDNILRDLCNILFVNPKPYVYGTICRYYGGMVREYTSEDVIRCVWRFVMPSYLDADNFFHKVEMWRWIRVENILQIRYKRNMSPAELVKHEEDIQRIAARFNNNKLKNPVNND